MAVKKIILDITPQTHVRATQGDRVLFKIPRNQLRPPGLKRLMRLERYNEYKVSVLALAKQQRFIFPPQGAEVTFYIPVSPSWRKWKKEQMHLRPHSEKPDIDNLFKSLGDSLLVEDKHIYNVCLTKLWVNQERGWVEITVHESKIGLTDTLK